MFRKKKQYKFSSYRLNKTNLALDYLLMPFLKTDLDIANFSKEQQVTLLSEFDSNGVESSLLRKIESVNLGNYKMSSYGSIVKNENQEEHSESETDKFDGERIKGLLMILTRLRWFQKIGKLSDEDFNSYSNHILRQLLPYFNDWQDYLYKMRHALNENALEYPRNRYNHILFTNFDYMYSVNKRRVKKVDWLTVEPVKHQPDEKAYRYEGLKFAEEDEKILTIMAIYVAWSKKAPYHLYPRTATQYKESLAILRDGWDINSREELLETVSQLSEGQVHYDTMNLKDNYISSEDMKRYMATLKYGSSERWSFETEIEKFQFEKEYKNMLSSFNEAHIQFKNMPTLNYLGVQSPEDIRYLMNNVEVILDALLSHQTVSVMEMMSLGLIEGGFEYLSKLNLVRELKDEELLTFNDLPNIKAWDLCRAGNIMLHGYLVGYAELEEFFDVLNDETLSVIRDEFVDWDHYLLSFLTGRFLWDTEVTLNSLDEFYDRINRYIHNSENQVLFDIWEKHPISGI